VDAAPGETGRRECPTCAMQMAHGTGYGIEHHLTFLEAALVENGRDGDAAGDSAVAKQ